VVHNKLPDQTGGVIAVNSRGDIVCDFNCGGMFRGVTSGPGDEVESFVAIYEEKEPLEAP
jgi:isoaspartyl peptidase/L-asparaginase-like protein (Ntn-hydrolase superfamily)